MKKRILASLMCVCLLVGLLPTAALATEDTAGEATACTVTEGCTLEDGHEGECVLSDEAADDLADASSGEYDVDEDTIIISAIQERIDALPDADTLADMDEGEQAEVYAEVCDIYDAIDELTDEEADELDASALEDTAAFFTQQIMSLEGDEDTTAASILASGGELASGTYELTANVTLTDDLTIPAGAVVTIDLNGHTLTGTGTDSVITVYGTLTIKDSGTSGKITGGKGPSDDTDQRNSGGGGVYVALNATLYLTGGTISGNKAGNGAGIRVDGTLNMTGGTVSDNEATGVGGGIYSNGTTVNGEITGGIINISGGTVSGNKAAYGGGVRGGGTALTLSGDAVVTGNTATTGGGGVYAFRSFTMSGGTISSNETGTTGGGVFVAGTTGSFEMSGGTISNNTSTSSGGGVYTAGTFEMKNGTISGNTGLNGGGVDTIGNATMTMSGGTISGNKAEGTNGGNGGGVRANGASFTMSGGTISGNTAVNGGGLFTESADGGAITLSGSAKISDNKATNGGGIRAGGVSFTMSGGEISGNEATTNGGGVWLNNKAMTMTAGTISGNKVGTTSDKAYGGGVYVSGANGVLTMSGGTISGNSNTYSYGGAGVYINRTGALKVSGSPTITGNKLSDNSKVQNVYLPETVFVTLDDALSNATIGITSGNASLPATNTNLQVTATESSTTHYTSSYSCFVADVSEKEVPGGGSTVSYLVVPQANTTDSKNCVEFVLKRSYTITFNENIGDDSETSTQKVPGATETALEANTFTRTGYTFQNWSTQQNGGDTTYNDKDNITTSADVTLYAQWKANEYTITYNLNGGTAGNNPPTTHTYDTATTLVDPTRTDYTFGGWFTNSDFSGTKVTSLGATDYTDNITLYALWTKTIGENGSYAVDEIPAQTYTGAAITPDVVVRNKTSGDIIASSQYSVEYQDNTGAGTASVTITKGSDAVTVNFTISQDASPTVEMAAVSVTYGTPYTMTATAKTSAGNAITDGTITIKYYTDENCTTGEATTAPTAAGTYYAKAVLTGTDNYAEASKVAKITITKADFAVTAQGYDGTYDGEAHSITVTAESASVTYSTDGTTFSETNPTFTGAGEYTVYYKVSKANYNDVTGSVAVKIAKATPTISISADKTSLTGSGTVTLTVDTSNLPTGATVSVSCDNTTYNPTLGTDGKYTVALPNSDGTYTFTVAYAGDDNHNAVSDTCSVTVTRRTSGGGGGGSSSGSSSSTTTETVTNKDGSKTTIVTDKKTGTVTETTKYKDGSTLVVETKKDGTVTTTETAANGVKVKTVDEPREDVTATVTIPRSVGTTTVTIPADTTPGTVAVDAKTGEIVKLSVPTEDGLTVKLDGSADLVLVDKSKDFTDTRNHWAEDAIDFATAHGMFGGTSAATFTPDGSMTRGMIAVVLHNFEDNPDHAFTGSFDDVHPDSWYADGIHWMVDNGIAGGYGNGKFGADDKITREQLATFLYRYADVMGYGTSGGASLSGFTDAGSVSGYATEAMQWAVGNGLIGGMGNGTLAPQGNATRAQVATILMRFVENLTK